MLEIIDLNNTHEIDHKQMAKIMGGVHLAPLYSYSSTINTQTWSSSKIWQRTPRGNQLLAYVTRVYGGQQ